MPVPNPTTSQFSRKILLPETTTIPLEVKLFLDIILQLVILRMPSNTCIAMPLCFVIDRFSSSI